MFLHPDSPIANGVFKKWNTLYSECQKNAIHIVTLNTVTNYDEISFFVFLDYPRINNPIVRKALSSNAKKILFLEEGPLVYPANWKIKNHRLFDFIFTWNDDFVDNVKYFKFNVHQIRTMHDSTDLKDKLCVLISRNKRAWGKSDLYSTRRSIIRYFEKNHPKSFDLYGEGWNMFYFPSNVPILKLFNGSKMYWLRSRLLEKYPSWKGAVENKIETVRKYKFSFALENSIGPSGYITEKIWDSFQAGTVPIYYGAPNILHYIPENCFIDFSKFKNMNDLYSYIHDMKDNVYQAYINNIRKFLCDDHAMSHSSDVSFIKSFINILQTDKSLYRS